MVEIIRSSGLNATKVTPALTASEQGPPHTITNSGPKKNAGKRANPDPIQNTKANIEMIRPGTVT
jgi:hypothetical protein